MAFMSLESPNCQVPVGCKTIIIQKNQASAYPVCCSSTSPAAHCVSGTLSHGKKRRDMTKSRQKNSKENKLLLHYRFLYSDFLPRKSKSNIYLCIVTLLFCEDIPKTQQCPRICQKQQKRNHSHQQFGNISLLSLCVQQCSLTHTFNLTLTVCVFKNFIKFRIRWFYHKLWVPAIARDHSLIHFFWNGIFHLHEQLYIT